MKSALQLTESYIRQLFSDKLPKEYYYHDSNHTIEVVNTARIIALNSNLSDIEIESVLIASWFHDSGLTQIYQGHEDISVLLAEAFLSQISHPLEQINKIKKIILATKMPHTPENILEEIISDADISHMGKDIFDQRSLQLRKEWEIVYNREYSEKEWLEINIRFMQENLFLTDYCKRNLNQTRLKNLEIYLQRLRQLNTL